MSNDNIIRAWKYPVYRASLSESERAALPANPAGAVEFSDAELGKVAAGLMYSECGGACTTGQCYPKAF
jgi:mersacidin/lichenicidin family type 2 lantibiotic